MKGAYALRRDEALRQKRYMRMALLRDHLTPTSSNTARWMLSSV